MAMRFYMRYLAVDPSGYYHPRWDRATPAEILANTNKEATEKLLVVIGGPPSCGSWSIIIDKISEEHNPTGGGEDE